METPDFAGWKTVRGACLYYACPKSTPFVFRRRAIDETQNWRFNLSIRVDEPQNPAAEKQNTDYKRDGYSVDGPATGFALMNASA